MLNGKALLISYSVFSVFEYYMTLHALNFRGASRVFGLVLNVYALLVFVFSLGFLIYCGFAFKWYLPIVLVVVSLLVGSLVFELEAFLVRLTGRPLPIPFLMSLSAFFVLPVCGFFMISSLRAR